MLTIPDKEATEITFHPNLGPLQTNLIREAIEGNLLGRGQFFRRTLEKESHITLHTTTIPSIFYRLSTSPYGSNNEAMSEPILLEVKKVELSYTAHYDTGGILWG